MPSRTHNAFIASSFALVVFGAEAASSIAGHWEGAIHAPIEDVVVAVDLTIADSGALAGTFSSPGQKLTGYPLRSANVDGETVRLELKFADPGVRTFDGRLSADGQTITGQFLIDIHAVPFTLNRNGEARVAPPPKSDAIDTKLLGSWRGALSLGAQSLPFTLTLTNQPDRTATGTWAAGEAPATPVRIAYDGGTLTLTSPVTPTSFTGTLSADGTQLAGTLTDGATPRLVVLTRVPSGG